MRRNSSRLSLASALSLALLATTAVAQQTQSTKAGPAPKMVLKETTFNAGDVAKGDVINHEFVVENKGSGDLQILTVKPACGCTTPGFDKIIAPGGSGKITLRVDTARFKGPISKSASVTTNDPSQPNARLVVNATVKTFVDILPRDIVTFRQYRGEEKKQELSIHSNEEGAFEIKDVQVNGDSIKHELGKAADGSGDYTLAVWLDKDAKIGTVNGSLKLLTSSAKEPELNVTVRGNVLGQISLNPSTLYFRVDGSKKELQVTGNSLNMRDKGELKAAVVAKLAKGERLTVLEDKGEWQRVRTSTGTEGWVFSKLVEPVGGAASQQSKVLNVSHRQQGSFKITKATVIGQKIDASALKIDTEAVRDGGAYRVTVTYEGGLDKGNYTGKVVLETTDSEEPSVEVPLYIVVT